MKVFSYWSYNSFQFRGWFGLRNRLSHVRSYYFRLGTKWKSCPIVMVFLLSNNYWPIFDRTLIGIFGRTGFSRIGFDGTKIFLIIPKLIFSIFILSGGGLNTSCNGKSGSVSWNSWIVVSKECRNLYFSI